MKKLFSLAIVLLFLSAACNTRTPADGTFERLPAATFAEKMAEGPGIVLDVRTADEFKDGHIEGAVQYDYYETASFETALKNMDKDATYYLYCRSGGRSGTVFNTMQQMGFSSVYELEGGILAWRKAGLPVSRP